MGRLDEDSDAAIARLAGISKSAFSRARTGQGGLSAEQLLALADALQTTPRWLLYGKGPAEAEDAADFVNVPEINLAYGLGGTFLDTASVESRTLAFPRSWLRQFVGSDGELADLFFADGAGDSMMPTILDQDTLIINRRQTSVTMADRIWVIAYGEVGMIKRIRPMPDGSHKIMSDNPAIETETAFDGEMHVIGRVVAIVRKT